jgi:hypothetical protein
MLKSSRRLSRVSTSPSNATSGYIGARYVRIPLCVDRVIQHRVLADRCIHVDLARNTSAGIPSLQPFDQASQVVTAAAEPGTSAYILETACS